MIIDAASGASADQTAGDFFRAGALIVGADEVGVTAAVMKVDAPTFEEITKLRKGAMIVSMATPGRSPELVEALAAHGVTWLAVDAVPRISRAQSMDVLSSMAMSLASEQ